ncbi:MAG: alpha/beta fold hydrolase [Ardenticatenaceae bacterium]|nr:alpha/beta fold hydrolase [Ardenticatenaceae bacterium]
MRSLLTPPRRIALAIVVVFMVIGHAMLRYSRPLHLNLDDLHTVHRFYLTRSEVSIRLDYAEFDDNGPVLLTVYRESENLGEIEANYNYDFFSREPAGWVHYWWMDGDLWPDVVILPNDVTQSCYVVLSQTNELQTCDGRSSTAEVSLDQQIPTPPATAQATSTPVLNPSPSSTPESNPTATPTNVSEPVPTATPDPLLPFTLAGLQADTYPAGQILVTEIVEQTAAYTHSAITYQSDGLTITGRLHLPAGEGPFPVIILIHGYMPREEYRSGWGTWQSAAYFAEHGYIAIAPDLRSWGGSESGPSLFQTGLVRDVLYLISAIESLPQADPSRVGLWGHSMGGGIATKAVIVDSRISAAVLYAPNSANDADLLGRWGAACRPGQVETAEDICNPSEILPASPELIDAYYSAAADPQKLQGIAPIYHLDKIQVPLHIHIGSEDGQTINGTPPEWSAALAEGLEAAGRDFERFVYEGQGHFLTGESWLLMMERSLALFDQTLK